MERVKSEGKWDPEALLADVYAYTGRFQEAAKLYKKTGNAQKAIDMYTELNMWDQATAFAQDTHTNMESILHRKAQMQHDRNDLLAAAETYAQVGDYMKAIDILGPNGRLDKLIDVARKLDQGDTKGLSRCVYFFRKNNHHAYAAETLVKMGDIAHLLKLHIELQHWEEAFKLAETHPELLEQIYLPYANYLATNGDFLEAQENFRKAGKVEEALRVLGELTENAVIEHRFDDAAYYYWTMSSEQLDIIPRTTPLEELSYAEKSALASFRKFYALAEVYYAYYYISRYIDEPFTSHLPETLFNMARFILHYLNHNETPTGVSKVYTLYALARLSQALGAFKVARYAFEKLQTMVIPPQWQEIIDVGALTIKAHPNLDKETLQPVCYRCSTLNPLVNPKGNKCTTCGEPFLVSFHSFVSLPVVQFAVEDGVGHEEAMRLVFMDPLTAADNKRDNKDDAAKPKGGLIGAPRPSSALPSKDDPFARQLALLTTTTMGTSSPYTPLLVGRKALIAMDRQSVLVRHWDRACIPAQYFKTMITDVPIVCCKECKQVFLEDEWAYRVLKGGACPFCRGRVEL